MFQEELTNDLRRLAAELDELGESESSQPPSFPPIADFEPVSLLGCGGMGAVYVARQISLGRDVAVKVVPENVSDTPTPCLQTCADFLHRNRSSPTRRPQCAAFGFLRGATRSQHSEPLRRHFVSSHSSSRSPLAT